MCNLCDGISERITISHQHQYFQLIDQIKKFINLGILELVQENCNIFELKKSNPFPDDVLFHQFECTSCQRKFELSVETYHGSGGAWDVCN